MKKKILKKFQTPNELDRTDYIISLILFGFGLFWAIILWWQIRYLPFIGESANILVSGAQLLEEKNFSSLTLTEVNLSHPTLLSILLSQLWNYFGKDTTVTHSLMIPFLPLLLAGIYLNARRFLTNTSALLVAFISLAMPITIREFQLTSLDLVMASLFFTSLGLWNTKRYTGSMLILAMSVLVRPAAILFMPMFIYWFTLLRKNNKQSSPDYKVLFLPAAAFLLWYFYVYSLAGWWFISPDSLSAIPKDPQIMMSYGFVVLRRFSFQQLRWIFILPTIALFIWKRPLAYQLQFLNGFLLSGVFFLMYISFFGNFNLAYVLPHIYAILIMFYIVLEKVSKDLLGTKTNWLLTILGFGFFALQLLLWKPQISTLNTPGEIPDNLTIQNRIFIARQMAAYINSTFPEAKIYGGFPEAYQLTQPFQGYTDQALDFALCQNFQISPDRPMILINHTTDPSQIACKQLSSLLQVTPLTRFELNNDWIQVYSIDGIATSSAEPEENL